MSASSSKRSKGSKGSKSSKSSKSSGRSKSSGSTSTTSGGSSKASRASKASKSSGRLKGAKGPKVKNEGQRMFLELEGGEAELAAKVGCGAAIVGHWRRGRRVPGDAHRHKLELLFGIPRRAWDVAPGAELPASTSTKSATSEDATLEITKSQIASILTALESEALTDASRAKLRDTLAKLLALRARMERDQETAEDRAVREHPAWVQTKASILRALKSFPEAAAAVVKELEE